MRHRSLIAILATFLAASFGFSGTLQNEKIDWAAFLGRNDLVWTELGNSWVSGPYVGDGRMGAQIYHESTNTELLRIELSRSDLYSEYQAGYRVPSGHLYLRPVGKIKSSTARLDLWNAEASGVITTDQGKIKWNAFVPDLDSVLRFEIEGSGAEEKAAWEYVPDRAVNTRLTLRKTNLGPNDQQPEPVVSREGDTLFSLQPFNKGGAALTSVREIRVEKKRVLLASIFLDYKNPDLKGLATKTLDGLNTERAKSIHLDGWHDFYQKSFLSVPDSRLESFYWIQLCKLRSATRENRPAIDLMGPWFQPSAWLAYWMNLNIQLVYWPVYAGNHLELGETLQKMIADHRDNLISNAPAEWQNDSAAIGRATGENLLGGVKKAGGGELGNLAFVLHNLWWQYRYSMDDKMLRELLYPLLTRVVNFYRHNFIKTEDGRYHLPLSTSPEYEQKAEDCNFDLSLLRWACQSLIRSAERLKIDEPLVPVWKDILKNLTPYPVDETGIMIGKDVPLEHSHRHFSHLFMIFPLGTMDLNGSDRELVIKSVNHWLGLTGAHAGYSYTGGAAMSAYLGDGDRALSLLNTLFTKYVQPNTMYRESVNPVIETPPSGARSMQEMLLQSHNGLLNVFPAIPGAWSNAVFRDLRAEGAFLVSGIWKNGHTVWIRIESLAGEPCVLKTDLKSPKISSSRPLTLSQNKNGFVEIPLERGEWIVLSDGSDHRIESVTTRGPDNPWGSVKRQPPTPILADEKGAVTLPASNAQLNGELLSYFTDKNRNTLGRWVNAGDYPSWRAQFSKPGKYKITACYGSPGGTTFELRVGAETIAAETKNTGGFESYREIEIGSVNIPSAGVLAIEMRPLVLKGGALGNLKYLRVEPE